MKKLAFSLLVAVFVFGSHDLGASPDKRAGKRQSVDIEYIIAGDILTINFTGTFAGKVRHNQSISIPIHDTPLDLTVIGDIGEIHDTLSTFIIVGDFGNIHGKPSGLALKSGIRGGVRGRSNATTIGDLGHICASPSSLTIM